VDSPPQAPHLPPDKAAVARNFSRAAGSYDGWARAQALIARSLADRLPRTFSPSLAVDVGCGTGLLSAALLARFPSARIVGIDLAEGMTEACAARFSGERRARFVTADAEGEALPVTGADLVAGACAAQWFRDPEGTLARWGASLAPGGILAFALLLSGSFPELRRAYREALGRDFPGLPLPDPSLVDAVARRAGLKALCGDEEEVAADYGSPREALRSFRAIGASFLGHEGRRPLSFGETRRLLDRYGDGAGCGTVTHRVQYFVAERTA
jgi:malonyl-CoA O-methyltransferase